MARQLAKAKHYGVVQGWLQAPDRPVMNMNAACHQAFNKLVCSTYHGHMISLKNGTRRNIYTFADGRIVEATKLGNGHWKHEKCGR